MDGRVVDEWMGEWVDDLINKKKMMKSRLVDGKKPENGLIDEWLGDGNDGVKKRHHWA